MFGYFESTCAGATEYGWSLSAKNVFTKGAKFVLQMDDHGVRIGRIDRGDVVVCVP